MINLFTIFAVSISAHYKDIKRDTRFGKFFAHSIKSLLMITAINIFIKYIGSIYTCFKAKYPRTNRK